MPVDSSVIFASHIGHTGKTTMCFQMASVYAAKNPQTRVLVIDFTEEGDLTKRMLGGVESSSNTASEVFGKVFSLIGSASDASKRWFFGKTVNVEDHAVKLHDYNQHMQENIYLISSGSWPTDEATISAADRKAIAQKIKEGLVNSAHNWKVFIDTDGDRRPSTFTLIGYLLADHVIVPLTSNRSDMDRVESMFYVLEEFRQKGEFNAKVLMIIWNMLRSNSDKPMEYNGRQLTFTPTKVNLSIMDACNKRLLDIAEDLPHLFVESAKDTEKFLDNSTYVMRDLADNVLRSSEEFGMPFVRMAEKLQKSQKKSLPFKSGSVEYLASDTTIAVANGAIEDLSSKFEHLNL